LRLEVGGWSARLPPTAISRYIPACAALSCPSALVADRQSPGSLHLSGIKQIVNRVKDTIESILDQNTEEEMALH